MTNDLSYSQDGTGRMIKGIYAGIVIPIKVFNLIDEFLDYSKDFQKTGKDKLNAIVESCKRHRISDYDIRKIVNHLWSELNYSESHKRRLLSEHYPELVNTKFANTNTNKNKEATKIVASTHQGQGNQEQLPQEMTGLFHSHDTDTEPEPPKLPELSKDQLKTRVTELERENKSLREENTRLKEDNERLKSLSVTGPI